MLMTVAAATELAGYQDVDRLRQLIREGQLEAHEVDKRIYVDYEDVVAYMQGKPYGRGRPRGPQK